MTDTPLLDFEAPSQLSLDGFGVPAIFSTIVNVRHGPDGTRIMFADNMVGGKPHWHSAIVMPTSVAIGLLELLANVKRVSQAARQDTDKTPDWPSPGKSN